MTTLLNLGIVDSKSFKTSIQVENPWALDFVT